MFKFFGKKDDKKELKKAVIGSPVEQFLDEHHEEKPQPIFIDEVPEVEEPKHEEVKREETIKQEKVEKPAETEEVQKAIRPVEKKEKPLAPVFIKVEKYKEIISTIEEIKILLRGTKQIFSILSEIEGIRDDALKILSSAIQRAERDVIAVDSYMLRPPELEIEEKPSHIEKSLEDLQKQLQELKTELNKIKK